MRTMGFELPKAFQMESRRLLWLIGLVFATIILFQCVELPKGNARWWMFSRGETASERVSSFFSDNSTLNSGSLSNMTSPSALNTSSNSNSSFTEKADVALLPGQTRNFSFDVGISPSASPSVSVNASNSSLGLVNGQNTPMLENPELSFPPENDTLKSNSSFTEVPNEDVALTPVIYGNFSVTLPPFAPPPVVLVHDQAPPADSDPKTSAPSTTMDVDTRSANNVSPPSTSFHVPVKKPRFEMPAKEVLTLSDMNELLIQSYLSPYSMIPRWPSKADQDLVFAKSEIEKASLLNNNELYAPLYRDASRFQRSYELMEKTLKVYIYKEGDRPIFHTPPLAGLYASEGWFMKMLEENKHFVTKRPREAHLFYLPFSSRMLEERLYVPNSHSHKNLIQHLKNYLDMISAKYSFWNRTNGADHFLVACHDWAPSETKRHMGNCIRALCNADVKEGFKFGKDVSLPETYVRKARYPLRDVGGKPPSKRKTLAFFAGNMHGYLRPILLQHWGNTSDPDMQIFGRLPQSKGNRNYLDYMKSSKYCICPRGYEVNSPRVVEAIFYECVPVIISDNFVPPLFETLNWESFAVFVKEDDIPNLKNILLSIPEKTYFRMHMRVKKVQRHFLWHPKPVKYDLFHMILHSIWHNRVSQFRPR